MQASPYGLMSLWQQGDWVTKSVAICLLIMSIVSWYIIITRAGRLIANRKRAHAIADFWHAQNFAAGLEVLSGTRQENPFRLLAEAAAAVVDHHRAKQADLQGQLSLSDWIISCLKGAIDEATEAMQDGISLLASIGSTAPFVGLLGTVWGIYHALISISLAGQANIDKIAGPVGEALIMTAFGLVVAIPAVLGYNALVRGNRAIIGKLNRFAHDLHAYFVTGARVNESRALRPALDQE